MSCEPFQHNSEGPVRSLTDAVGSHTARHTEDSGYPSAPAGTHISTMTTVTGSAKTAGQPQLAEARILVFDRDDDVRDSLKVLLESNGLAIEAFADPTEFLTAATSQSADCLILGFNRLIVEGLDMLAALQRSQVQSPAIFVVGGGNALTRAAALGAGADAYLERPIEESTLIRALVDALPRRQTRALLQSKQG